MTHTQQWLPPVQLNEWNHSLGWFDFHNQLLAQTKLSTIKIIV